MYNSTQQSMQKIIEICFILSLVNNNYSMSVAHLIMSIFYEYSKQ